MWAGSRDLPLLLEYNQPDRMSVLKLGYRETVASMCSPFLALSCLREASSGSELRCGEAGAGRSLPLQPTAYRMLSSPSNSGEEQTPATSLGSGLGRGPLRPEDSPRREPRTEFPQSSLRVAAALANISAEPEAPSEATPRFLPPQKP